MNFTELSYKVIQGDLCTRCGLCIGICPANVIKLGRDNYPVLDGDCQECGLCVKSCPGAEADFQLLSRQVFQSDYLAEDIQGHLENMFVAHAADEDVRASGTSGGLITGLLIYLLENKIIDGAVVAGFNADAPCAIRGILATTPEEILNAGKSKYCISSSMDALQLLRGKKGRFVVVGLPCQVQGLRKAMAVNPALAKKIYSVFGLYCHCNMEPYVQLDILKNQNIKPSNIKRFNFRGGKWPGGFHVVGKDGNGHPLHNTLYTTILNVLFKIYGAPRCYLCVDALSEFADISFGDFWAQDYDGELSRYERCTIVSQRTTRGMEIMQNATENGAIISHRLPEKRYSKRIINMARGKKRRNQARIYRMHHNGQKTPKYNIPITKPGTKTRFNDLILRWTFLFRGPLARKLLLKLLFSPAAKTFERLNLYRKRKFCNYHGN